MRAVNRCALCGNVITDITHNVHTSGKLYCNDCNINKVIPSIVSMVKDNYYCIERTKEEGEIYDK